MSASRSLSDTETFNESATRLVAFVRLLSDTALLTDVASENVGFVRNIVDSASLSDALSRILSLSRGLSDTESFADSPSHIQLAETITDTFSVVESVLESCVVPIWLRRYPTTMLMDIVNNGLYATAVRIGAAALLLESIVKLDKRTCGSTTDTNAISSMILDLSKNPDFLRLLLAAPIL